MKDLIDCCSFKGDAEVAVSGAPCAARGAKQRKLSSVRDSDKTETEPPKETKAGESEQQPDIKVEDHVQGDAGKTYILKDDANM